MIERVFRERFRPWELTLPAADLAERRRGHLFARGWHIGYVWGREGGEEYLEVLAQHRMTDDSRFRIFASGRVEQMPAPNSMWSHRSDASEEEIRAARQASIERNRRLYDELRELGLLPPAGGNLPAHEITEYLASGGDVDEGDDSSQSTRH